MCELKRGPIVVDGADFVIDEASRERLVADMVLVEVDVVLPGAFGMDDPGRCFFWQTKREQIESCSQVLQRANEAESEAGLWGEARSEGGILRKIAEALLKGVRGGDERKMHVGADA